jgi:predicted aspartyl protease
VRRIVALVCFLALVPVSFPADRSDAKFKSLYDAHQWFALRDAVKGGNAPAFYRGATACAFNELPHCEKELEQDFKSEAKSEDAVEGHRILTSVYLRQGRYRNALVQADAVLALNPGDSDAQGDRPMLVALSEFPDQLVENRKASVLKLEENGLPISINGAKATYWFDSGANLSVMSESEAKRFGLSVRAVQTQASVMTGAQVAFKIALADELTIGSFRIKNVAFLVFPDDQPPFNELPQQSRGLVGLPVLLAFGRFSWAADGSFDLAPKPLSGGVPSAELCFEGKNPAVQVRFENRDLSFTLDTGASTTDLYPPFAAAFPELIRTSGKKETHQMTGVGSVENLNATVLPRVDFKVGGHPVALHPATVLLEPNGESSKFYYGNLGIDLLKQAKRVTMDFKRMSLTLQ